MIDLPEWRNYGTGSGYSPTLAQAQHNVAVVIGKLVTLDNTQEIRQ